MCRGQWDREETRTAEQFEHVGWGCTCLLHDFVNEAIEQESICLKERIGTEFVLETVSFNNGRLLLIMQPAGADDKRQCRKTGDLEKPVTHLFPSGIRLFGGKP